MTRIPVSKHLHRIGIQCHFLSKPRPQALAGDPAHLEAACHLPELQVLDGQQLQCPRRAQAHGHSVHSTKEEIACSLVPAGGSQDNHLAPWSTSQQWEAAIGQDTIKEALTGVRHLLGPAGLAASGSTLSLDPILYSTPSKSNICLCPILWYPQGRDLI